MTEIVYITTDQAIRKMNIGQPQNMVEASIEAVKEISTQLLIGRGISDEAIEAFHLKGEFVIGIKKSSEFRKTYDSKGAINEYGKDTKK